MRYFEKAQLSSSWRPLLQPNESLIIQQGSVGLYERKTKADQFQNGVCYLTSHRIIYVDNTYPAERAVELSLSRISDIQGYNGFLRASPKIIVYLHSMSYSETATSPLSPLADQSTSWICPICSFSNPPSSASGQEKCELCGVKRPSTVSTSSSSSSVSSPTPDNSGNTQSCPTCTFINHPSMLQCEMCGTDLRTHKIPITESTTPITPPDEPDAHVRIAFRNGGQPNFLSELRSAVNARAWEKPRSPMEPPKPASTPRGVGISAIQDRIEKTTLEANETMTDAFQDLDRLMAKATEMVQLAESISTKMTKDPTIGGDETSTLRTYFLELGISDPVTRNSAGSIYHQELARELGDFLSKFLDRDNAMKSLTDLYCVFNRARGVALISPEDLYKACQQFEPLQIPFRLRRFPSGLLVVHSLDMDDERAAKRVLRLVKDHNGCLTALRLSELEGLALTVATEQLLISEQKGYLCRDQGPAGLTFYENRFVF